MGAAAEVLRVLVDCPDELDGKTEVTVSSSTDGFG
jgi:hypothetical protein